MILVVRESVSLKFIFLVNFCFWSNLTLRFHWPFPESASCPFLSLILVQWSGLKKLGPHRRTPKNIGVKFPLVMGCTHFFTNIRSFRKHWITSYKLRPIKYKLTIFMIYSDSFINGCSRKVVIDKSKNCFGVKSLLNVHFIHPWIQNKTETPDSDSKNKTS